MTDKARYLQATTSLAGKGLVQAQQVVVVQKPSTSSPNHLLSSPKKADIRVIHPPGVTVRRQLQMTTTSGVGAGQGGVTKVRGITRSYWSIEHWNE